jgi:hypothetical protein
LKAEGRPELERGRMAGTGRPLAAAGTLCGIAAPSCDTARAAPPGGTAASLASLSQASDAGAGISWPLKRRRVWCALVQTWSSEGVVLRLVLSGLGAQASEP